MPTLQRLEVWSDFVAASGTRQAIIPLHAVSRLTTTERTTRDDEGTLELSLDSPGASALAVGAVVRFLFDDASFDEWRVAELVDTSRTNRLLRVQLQCPLFELGVREGPLSTTTSNVTALGATYIGKAPAAHVTTILAAAPTWWTAGTITPTIPVDLTIDGDMPLGALRKLVSALRAKGVDCELDYRRNGTSGYYVDLVTQIGSGATAVDVRSAKNLLETTRQRSLVQQASRVTTLGASGVRRSGVRATMALAFWRVASVSGSNVELRGLEGCPDPVLYDDQFNGAYLEKTDGTYTQITDTVASTQVVTVASATGVATNQWLRLVRNSSGDDLVTVANPTAAAPLTQATVLTLDRRTDRTNWCANPIFERWSAGAPVDWTETDTNSYWTVAEDTTRYQFGARSAKCTYVSPGGTAADVRLAMATRAVPPTGTSRTFVASVWVYRDEAASSYTQTATVRLSLGATVTDTLWTALPANAWTRLEVSRTQTGASVQAYVELRVGSVAATLVMNVGAMLVEELATPQTDMVLGSDPAFALAAANRYLGIYSTTPTAYRVAFADLAAWDATAFPYDGVRLGATANVRDRDLGIITAARIVELTRDWRNPTASAITAATRPPDLITLLSGIS